MLLIEETLLENDFKVAIVWDNTVFKIIKRKCWQVEKRSCHLYFSAERVC